MAWSSMFQSQIIRKLWMMMPLYCERRWFHLKDISASEISVIMKGRNSDILLFAVSDKTIAKGSNVFTLFNPASDSKHTTTISLILYSQTPVSGLFVIDHAEIRISRLVLRWSYSSTGLHSTIACKSVRKLIPAQALKPTRWVVVYCTMCYQHASPMALSK